MGKISLKLVVEYYDRMYHNSFLESKRYAKLHIENDMEVRNIGLAPFIVEGGSVFKKQSYFLGSIILGDNFNSREGQLVYRNGEFMGYNGEEWLSFTRDNLWKDGDGILYTNGRKVGINKINPKKMLEVGGDALIEKKLQVGDLLSCDNCILLQENQGKKRSGMIRFWENNFQGYNGEEWINFGANQVEQVEKNIEVDFENIQKIGLLNCPLVFKGDEKNYLWFDNNEFNFGKLHEGNMELIKHSNLHINELTLNGNINMNGKSTIKNLIDPKNGDEPATKRYVDTICQGLQNYLFVDYLMLEDDMDGDMEIRLKRECGELLEGDILGILRRERADMCEIVGMGDEIKLKMIQTIQTPAKLCIKKGRYGNSEYFVFDKENGYGYLQVNGMENLEYDGSIKRNGKKVELIISDIFTNDNKLDIKYGGITGDYIGKNAVSGMNICERSVNGEHMMDGIIENRHLCKEIINGSNIIEKSLGGRHMKDGFLKNNHFGAGIITERELGNECINMTHLKSSIILNKHISKNCINNDNIIEHSIDRCHLMDKIIDSKHLDEKIILGEHIGNGQIIGLHIMEKQINGRHIREREIMGEHINDKQIEGRHLGVGIVDGLHLGENSVGGSNIKEQSIGEKHLMRNSVMDWHIYVGQIRRNHLEDNIIDGSKICDKVIFEKHLGENIINTQHIRRGVINGNHIGMNVVDDRHIVNFSIKGNKLMEGIITETKLAENSVSSGKIKDKTITNDKIRLPFIKMETDQMFVCPKMVNLGDTLHFGLNSNYMIPRIRDGVVELMGSVRFGEEGSGQKMEVNMEMDVNGRMRVGGEDIFYMGEIRGFGRGIRIDLAKWIKCDGKRVKRSEYYELYEILGEKKEDGEDFYLPDIKHDAIDYYIRYKN